MTKWTSPDFYGAKSKRYFSMVDRHLIKLLKKDHLTDQDYENIAKLAGKQNQFIHTVNKLMTDLDTHKLLVDMHKRLDAIPEHFIAKYVKTPTADPMFGR